MNVVNQHDLVKQLAGTIIAGEVGDEGISLTYEDGRILILVGVEIACIARICKTALQ